jgi:hypothetical protein
MESKIIIQKTAVQLVQEVLQVLKVLRVIRGHKVFKV